MATLIPFIVSLRERLVALRVQQEHALVAVSGGADSVALLLGLCELREECGLALTVAHYNHRFRGDAADGDAAWVDSLATSLDLPVIVGRAESEGRPLDEATARHERYAFLEETARASGAAVIVTAHTRDDQVETVLHHLLRGTGVAGLQGIPHERQLSQSRIVRPLLFAARDDIVNYLSQHGQTHREDATNVDTKWTRNWLRHELLPKIRERFPHADEALARLSEHARETGDLTRQVGRSLLFVAVNHGNDDFVELSVAPMAGESSAAVREAFVQLWFEQGWPLREMSRERWNELARLVVVDSGAITLPGGIEARRQGPWLTIRVLPRP